MTALLKEIFSAIGEMPATMRQLAFVQLLTWLGLFCMWLFFGLMTSYFVFHAPDSQSDLFREGNEWGGVAFMVTSSLLAFALQWRRAVRAFAGLGASLGRRRSGAHDPMAAIETPASWFVAGQLFGFVGLAWLGHAARLRPIASLICAFVIT